MRIYEFIARRRAIVLDDPKNRAYKYLIRSFYIRLSCRLGCIFPTDAV